MDYLIDLFRWAAILSSDLEHIMNYELWAEVMALLGLVLVFSVGTAAVIIKEITTNETIRSRRYDTLFLCTGFALVGILIWWILLIAAGWALLFSVPFALSYGIAFIVIKLIARSKQKKELLNIPKAKVVT